MLLFSLSWLAARAHHTPPIPVGTSPVAAVPPTQQLQGSLLSTVKIELDANQNRIHFRSPHVLQNVDITVKHYGDQVLFREHGKTIDRYYSIGLSKPAQGGTYTVILQQDNQIVVKRLTVN